MTSIDTGLNFIDDKVVTSSSIYITEAKVKKFREGMDIFYSGQKNNIILESCLDNETTCIKSYGVLREYFPMYSCFLFDNLMKPLTPIWIRYLKDD